MMTLKLVAIKLLDDFFSEKIDALTYPNFHLSNWWMCVKERKVYVGIVIPVCDERHSIIWQGYNLAKPFETS